MSIAVRTCVVVFAVAALVGSVQAREDRKPARPDVHAAAAMVIDDSSGQVLYEKNADEIHPIASITKLMTAMVVVDAKLDPQERIEILEADKPTIKWSRSRLRVGNAFTRDDLLRIALMASDNRAAVALARTYPGGQTAAIDAMNRKARQLGLVATKFADPSGLSPENVATAGELVRLVGAAQKYPQIREYSTMPKFDVPSRFGTIAFINTNGLTRGDGWDIAVQKTGFIAEAGRCLVLAAQINRRPMTLVFLDAAGKYTPFADAHRVRQWLEPGYSPPANAVRRKAS